MVRYYGRDETMEGLWSMETKAARQQPRRERDGNLIVIGRRKPADNLHADAEAIIS